MKKKFKLSAPGIFGNPTIYLGAIIPGEDTVQFGGYLIQFGSNKIIRLTPGVASVFKFDLEKISYRIQEEKDKVLTLDNLVIYYEMGSLTLGVKNVIAGKLLSIEQDYIGRISAIDPSLGIGSKLKEE